MRRSVAMESGSMPLRGASDWSGYVWMDFLARLLIIIGMIAPPAVILSVVAYYATHAAPR